MAKYYDCARLVTKKLHGQYRFCCKKLLKTMDIKFPLRLDRCRNHKRYAKKERQKNLNAHERIIRSITVCQLCIPIYIYIHITERIRRNRKTFDELFNVKRDDVDVYHKARCTILPTHCAPLPKRSSSSTTPPPPLPSLPTYFFFYLYLDFYISIFSSLVFDLEMNSGRKKNG